MEFLAPRTYLKFGSTLYLSMLINIIDTKIHANDENDLNTKISK